MRLIEKSLTENIYNALNESSDQNKAAKRVARYKKSNRARMNESKETQLNDLYNGKKLDWTDLSGSDQTAVEYFSSNFGDNIEGKSWDEVESDIIEACYDIGYANEELINSGYWMDGDMDPEPDEKKVTDYIFQNYFLPKKNSKNMKESAETGKITLKDYAMNYFDGDIDMDVTDTEIGVLVAFVYDFNEEPKDNYDRFLNLLGERTEVVKVGNDVLTCDFSSVFKPYEDKLQDFFNMDYSEFNEAWAEAVSNLEALIPGMAGEKTYKDLIDILTSKQINESVDNDPDLDADQVQADIDYWTDVDEANTEDVSNMKPIGVYTVSNNSAIYVYQIEYDIEDRVLVGDSSDETKAKWRDIIYDDEDAYFWYGDIKIPFNNVVRTDI